MLTVPVVDVSVSISASVSISVSVSRVSPGLRWLLAMPVHGLDTTRTVQRSSFLGLPAVLTALHAYLPAAEQCCMS